MWFFYDRRFSLMVKSVIQELITFVGNQFNCDNVEYFTGNYSCKPEGAMAGTPSSSQSQPLTVNTVCKLKL